MHPFHLYYYVRSMIPRRMQIGIRRHVAIAVRARHKDTWPIDESAGEKPAGFVGWPEGKKFALLLRHDVEGPVGQDKCEDVLQMEAAFGLRSAFFFVPEPVSVNERMLARIRDCGCEIGVHGLRHDGKLYVSRKAFKRHALAINRYLRTWGACGFASPSSHHQLNWLCELDVEYDTSTFDTDPFEPQPDPLRSIFPVTVRVAADQRAIMEIPYTLAQDFTLFVILQERTIEIWKRKLDWLVEKGGLVHVNVHPDYWFIPGKPAPRYGYEVSLYRELLSYLAERYGGQFWNPLPRELVAFWRTVGSDLKTSAL